MEPHDIQTLAKAAAKEAVAELLVTLGVNAGDPAALIAMQKDFAYVRSWRESIEMVQRKGLLTAVAIIVSGALGAAWLAIRGTTGH